MSTKFYKSVMLFFSVFTIACIGCVEPEINSLEAQAWQGSSIEWSGDEYDEEGCMDPDNHSFLVQTSNDGSLPTVGSAKVNISWTASMVDNVIIEGILEDGSVWAIEPPEGVEPEGDTVSFNPLPGTRSIRLSATRHPSDASETGNTVSETIKLDLDPYPDLPEECVPIQLSEGFLAGKNEWNTWQSGGEGYECSVFDLLGDSPNCETCTTETGNYQNSPKGFYGEDGKIMFDAHTDLQMRQDFWERQHPVPAEARIWITGRIYVSGNARARTVVDFRYPDSLVSSAPEGSEGPFIYPDGQIHDLRWDMGSGKDSRAGFEPRDRSKDGMTRVIPMLAVDTMDGTGHVELWDVGLWCCGEGCGNCQDFDGDGFGTWCDAGFDCDDTDAQTHPGSIVGDNCGYHSSTD